MVGQPYDRSQVEHPFHRVLHGLASLFVDDAEHGGQRLALGLALRPTGQALRLTVEECHPTLGVGHDHPVADAGQSDGIQVFRCRQLRRALE